MTSGGLGVSGGTKDDDDPKHPFEAYFGRNWDSCRSMWCAFDRGNAVTLGNNTNNRIEASWKQLKDLVDSYVGVDECIASTVVPASGRKKVCGCCLQVGCGAQRQVR